MTKKEFVEKYAEKTGLSKKDALLQLDSFLDIIEDTLANDGTVQFIGWGSFETRVTKERIGRNPKTGVEATIPSRKVVKFKVGKLLADKVNK